MYKVLGWDVTENFISTLTFKNLSILEKDIPECSQYIDIKKAATPIQS
jgi:hypothetical protein